jgi:hypothetical protein
VAETFVVRKTLSEGLVKAAQQFWKKQSMSIKSIDLPNQLPGESGHDKVSFVAEGGTIWTTDFESYKKTVIVNLSPNEHQTEVLVQIILPGGLMSLQDREQAADLIDSFYEALEVRGS